MSSADNNGLGWYRVLLKLYPKAYRQEYEEEMLITLQEMFSSAKSPLERRQLLVRTVKDYLLSLSQQNLWATEQSFNAMPNSVKRESTISAILVAPFSIIFAYNIISLVTHHSVGLDSLEARTWVIYSIVLPFFALVLSIKTCFNGVFGQLIKRQWRKAFQTVFQEWLFLSAIVIAIAMVAIF